MSLGAGLSDIDLATVLAWTHGEWIRIHPFADFNGSTARLLVVATAALFQVPVDLPAKPRPATIDFGTAAGSQMAGDDRLMFVYLLQLL